MTQTTTTPAATPKLKHEIQQIRDDYYYQTGVAGGLDWERYGLDMATQRLVEIVGLNWHMDGSPYGMGMVEGISRAIRNLVADQ